MCDNELHLRAVDHSDLEWLYFQENKVELWQYSRVRAPMSRSFLRRLIDETLLPIEESKQFKLIIELRSENMQKPIGMIDLSDVDIHNFRAELGLVIYELQHRNCGYGTRIFSMFEKFVNQYLGLRVLYCHVVRDNEKAVSFFLKQKFEQVGVLKNWIRHADGCKDVVILVKEIGKSTII